MAKVRRNIILDDVSGRIGEGLVLRRARSGQTVLSRKPTFSEDRVFSPAQQAHQQRFREAAAYAKQASKHQPIYAELASKMRQPAYNVALADYMHPPEILAIDLAGYTGKAGQAIRIQARDDVKVACVSVKIVDANQRVIEQGLAIADAVGLWWTFATHADCPTDSVTVVVRVEDLPGNRVEKEWVHRLPTE